MEQREIEAILHVRSVVRDTAKQLGMSENKIIELIQKSEFQQEPAHFKTLLNAPERQANLHPSMQRMAKWAGTLSLEEAESLSVHTKKMREEWD
ncbi:MULTISPECIES: hypothetical protein [Saccharibacillus]|uniref:Uncharacterized protein n=1 Tax=Saccharibacillus brassicae TaxID=2583377 RepID=A0A4Y6UV16_SACBS|nr:MULTISPECIES: hypothetical protein [Saccharibacillus]MWJ31578.1 hypothetical protein [Saccharibacillus sp. WB 17]QDH20181.1 hypothetical protein FFV09_04495 [Saccharibacillus brassicae]